MSDGYISKDRQHLARLQRARRARVVRIDYTPGAQALAVIEAMRARQLPGSLAATNRAVIDAIVTAWATLAGINEAEIHAPMTTASDAGINRPFRAPAHDFGEDWPVWATGWLAAAKPREAGPRVVCGARRHRDGQPCQAKSEPGKQRCKWHGGRATGPRTDEGRAKALANLKQNRPS